MDELYIYIYYIRIMSSFSAAMQASPFSLPFQDLEAIKITYSQRRSQMESVLLVLAMLLLMFWPWYFLVEPLGESMKEVKVAYCGGYQDRSRLVWKMGLGM